MNLEPKQLESIFTELVMTRTNKTKTAINVIAEFISENLEVKPDKIAAVKEFINKVS